MDLFKLDPGLSIWTWITFGLLFFILAKFVIPNIVKNLQERENYIHSSVDKTAELEKRLSEMETERSELLKKAGEEADLLIKKTRQDAEELRKRLAAEAESEAREILLQARTQTEAERQAMLEAMKDDLAGLICEASEKVVGQTFTGSREKELARELVKEL
jgi:F-type H+-transporting ATPase subunit b